MASGQAIVAADDLLRIKGIGPAIVRRLHEAGISTCAQLAKVSSSEALVRRVPGLSVKRVEREGWLKQARRFAAKQHRETFNVDLLVDSEQRVVRTCVEHIQSGNRKSWGGWNKTELVDFLTQRSRLGPLSIQSDRKLSLVRQHARTFAHRQNRPPPGPVIAAPPVLPPEEHLLAGIHPSTESIASEELVLSRPDGVGLIPAGPETWLSGTLRVGELAIMPLESDVPCSLVSARRPFNVRLVMDLTEVTRPLGALLGYTITVCAKMLGQRTELVDAGRGRGMVGSANRWPCTVDSMIAMPGTYRLWVEAALTRTSMGPSTSSCLFAVSLPKLIHVY